MTSAPGPTRRRELVRDMRGRREVVGEDEEEGRMDGEDGCGWGWDKWGWEEEESMGGEVVEEDIEEEVDDDDDDEGVLLVNCSGALEFEGEYCGLEVLNVEVPQVCDALRGRLAALVVIESTIIVSDLDRPDRLYMYRLRLARHVPRTSQLATRNSEVGSRQSAADPRPSVVRRGRSAA